LRKSAIYPGSFDPISNGHLDVIRRASKIFDEVIVGVSLSADKNPAFALADRVEMAKAAIGAAEIKNARVLPFDCLLVDFAKSQGVKLIIRGLRAVSDYEYELQMGYANESLDPEIETIYFMPSLQYAFISSSVARSILRHGGDAAHLIPRGAAELVVQKSAKFARKNQLN
jgi:pantetheine-phosphate adenylyltransferase